MFQGTGSDVGKSLIVAGLCRLFANRGLKVRPFKPQNMSNNAAVTADGGEIGRAQALQALAARVPSSVHMNPVLLKPESTTGAQIILRGERVGSLKARNFMDTRGRFLDAILESYRRLGTQADLVLVEGAGSPAEINLRTGDIANMGFAEASGVPVVLVADIHRGGVIASIVGTFEVMTQEDAGRLKAFLVNKFHGDVSLFDDGVRFLEQRTGRPCLGVVPHFPDATRLPAEDAVALEHAVAEDGGDVLVAVPRLPRIANFDDLDPLRLEPQVRVAFIGAGEPLPAEARLVVLPGSKATIADLAFFRAQGWDTDLLAHVRRGGHVLGLCGGYQMLGRRIHDPEGIEGPPESVEGLGLLDVETTLAPDKTLTNVSARHVASGESLSGYEIHVGATTGPGLARPFATIGGRSDGAVSADGRVAGTYLHGCLVSDGFRRRFLSSLDVAAGNFNFADVVDGTLDRLADHLAAHLDIDRLLALAEPVG
ncbi:MAG: cobyric acid synthase [Parvibaculaceae bacterium]